MLFRNGPWICLLFVLAALYLIYTLDQNTHQLAKIPDQASNDDKTKISQTTLPKTGNWVTTKWLKLRLVWTGFWNLNIEDQY